MRLLLEHLLALEQHQRLGPLPLAHVLLHLQNISYNTEVLLERTRKPDSEALVAVIASTTLSDQTISYKTES